MIEASRRDVSVLRKRLKKWWGWGGLGVVPAYLKFLVVLKEVQEFSCRGFWGYPQIKLPP